MVTPIIYQQVTSSSVGGVQGGVATLATSWQGLVGLVWSVVFFKSLLSWWLFTLWLIFNLFMFPFLRTGLKTEAQQLLWL